MKNKIQSFIILSVGLSFLLFTSSCTKKQVVTGEKVSPVVTAPAGDDAEDFEVSDEEARIRAAAEQEKARLLQEKGKKQKLLNEIRAFESEKIYFDFDKSNLKPLACEVLENKANWLKNNSEFSIRIEGHCDERGTHEYNLALGDRRAYSAKKYLVALGISAERISTLSFGEERPADPGHGEEAWTKNRRCEFKLMK